jgi:hypothetical protein
VRIGGVAGVLAVAEATCVFGSGSGGSICSGIGSGFGSEKNYFWIFGLFRHAQRRVEPPSAQTLVWRFQNLDNFVGVAGH